MSTAMFLILRGEERAARMRASVASGEQKRERQSDRGVSRLDQVVRVIGHSRYHGAPDEDRGGHGHVPVGPGRFPVGPGRFPVGPGRSRNRA